MIKCSSDFLFVWLFVFVLSQMILNISVENSVLGVCESVLKLNHLFLFVSLLCFDFFSRWWCWEWCPECLWVCTLKNELSIYICFCIRPTLVLRGNTFKQAGRPGCKKKEHQEDQIQSKGHQQNTHRTRLSATQKFKVGTYRRQPKISLKVKSTRPQLAYYAHTPCGR